MKKIVLFLLLITLKSLFSYAQDNSLSINYLNIGNGNKTHWNSGLGVQGKIQLKNRFYLLPDMGYIFEHTETTYMTDQKSFRKEADSYLFANINLTYSFNLGNSFTILPYIGAGYYHNYTKMYAAIKSHEFYGDVIEKYSTGLLMANMGLLTEVYLTRNIFLTAGCKYMLDTYNSDSYIPYFNIGLGYRF